MLVQRTLSVSPSYGSIWQACLSVRERERETGLSIANLSVITMSLPVSVLVSGKRKHDLSKSIPLTGPAFDESAPADPGEEWPELQWCDSLTVTPEPKKKHHRTSPSLSPNGMSAEKHGTSAPTPSPMRMSCTGAQLEWKESICHTTDTRTGKLHSVRDGPQWHDITMNWPPVLDEWLTRELTVGVDFSGLAMPVLALEKLQVPFRHVFSCELGSDACCQRLIAHRFKPASISPVSLTDIASLRHRSNPASIYNDRREPVDLYVFGAPCVKSCSEGSGVGDPRLISAACKYCLRARPRIIVSENQVDITHKKHANILNELTAALAPHYVLHSRILNSADYGLRQQRQRWYFVAIRKDCYMARDTTCATGQTGFCWPRGSTLVKPDIEAFLDPEAKCDTWKRLPDTDAERRLVKTAWRKLKKAGLHPDLNPTFVNTSCQALHRTNEMCTMTRARCARFQYWVTSRGRPVTLSELARFQGAELTDWGDLDKCGLRVSRCQFASMLGAAESLPVVMYVLKQAISATNLD